MKAVASAVRVIRTFYTANDPIVPGARSLESEPGRMGLQGIALACARHPWRTIVAWIVLVVLAVFAIATLLSLTTDGNPTNDPQSQRAKDLLVHVRTDVRERQHPHHVPWVGGAARPAGAVRHALR